MFTKHGCKESEVFASTFSTAIRRVVGRRPPARVPGSTGAQDQQDISRKVRLVRQIDAARRELSSGILHAASALYTAAPYKF